VSGMPADCAGSGLHRLAPDAKVLSGIKHGAPGGEVHIRKRSRRCVSGAARPGRESLFAVSARQRELDWPRATEG